MTTSQSYNGAGELSAFAARYGSTELLTTSYGRDSLGRITSLTETIVDSTGVPTTTSWGYEYDPAGRLERASSGEMRLVRRCRSCSVDASSARRTP